MCRLIDDELYFEEETEDEKELKRNLTLYNTISNLIFLFGLFCLVFVCFSLMIGLSIFILKHKLLLLYVLWIGIVSLFFSVGIRRIFKNINKVPVAFKVVYAFMINRFNKSKDKLKRKVK